MYAPVIVLVTVSVFVGQLAGAVAHDDGFWANFFIYAVACLAVGGFILLAFMMSGLFVTG